MLMPQTHLLLAIRHVHVFIVHQSHHLTQEDSREVEATARLYIGDHGSIEGLSEMVQTGSTPVAAGSNSISQVAYQQPIEVVTSQTVCQTSMGC